MIIGRILAAWAILCVVGGCYGFIPRATKQKVSAEQLAGVWEYDNSDTFSPHVVLTLDVDGTFEQVVYRTGYTNLVCTGQWNVVGSKLSITLLNPMFGNQREWILEKAGWYIIDNPNPSNGRKFLIFGAAEDTNHDDFYAFEPKDDK